MFDPRNNLPARAALFVAAGATVFVVLLAWIAGLVLHRHLEHQLGATFDTLAYQVSDKLDRALYTRYRELKFTAALDTLRSPTATPEARRRVLEELQNTSEDFAWVGFADTTGQLVATTGRIFESTPVDRQEWFLLGQEAPFVGTPREHPELAQVATETDYESPQRFITLSVPVLDHSGRRIGVLGAHLHWGWARDIQLSVVPGSARRQHLGATVYAGNKDVLLDSGASGNFGPPPAPTLNDPQQTRGILFEKEGRVTFLTGYVVSRGYREYRGLGWMTTVRQPVEIAFAPVQALRSSIVGAGMLLIGGLSLLAWLYARRHVRRISVIANAAERIREGDILTVIPPPHGDTELDHLCRSVGTLVEELRPKSDKPDPAAPLAAPRYSPAERIERSV